MRASFCWLIIAAFALAAVATARATPGSVLVTRTDGVPLRAEPALMAAALRDLEQGQRLLEFRRRGDWVEVAVFGLVGVRGWVRSESVTPEQALAGAPVAPPSPERGTDTGEIGSFVLDVAGTPALAFRARCQLAASDGERPVAEHAGLVPQRIAMTADAVSCRVRKHDAFGRLRVSLRSGMTVVAAAETRAPYNWVRVRSDGPWGAAGGLRGSVGLVFPAGPEAPPRGPPIDSLPRPLPR